MNGMTMPTVWVFPALHVCLQCGSAEFAVPADQLGALADGINEAKGKSA